MPVAYHSIASRSQKRTQRYVSMLSLIAVGLLPMTASAADATANTYQQERTNCTSGGSHQDRATCLREAAAARGEARRGNLTDSTSYEENALARCNTLPPSDRQDCAKRVQGQGVVSGSVEGGGLYRETTTTVIGTPQPSTMPAPAPVYQPMPVSPQGTMPR